MTAYWLLNCFSTTEICFIFSHIIPNVQIAVDLKLVSLFTPVLCPQQVHTHPWLKFWPSHRISWLAWHWLPSHLLFSQPDSEVPGKALINHLGGPQGTVATFWHEYFTTQQIKCEQSEIGSPNYWDHVLLSYFLFYGCMNFQGHFARLCVSVHF